MSRSTLLGGGGEKTSRLKNSQKVGEADMADVFEQGFTQLSSKDRSAVRPIISYFLAWCWWWRASLERGNVIFLWFSTLKNKWICFPSSILCRKRFFSESLVVPWVFLMPWGFFRQISRFLILLSWFFPQCSFGRSNLFPRRVPKVPMLRLTPVMPLWWVSSLSCHYAHRTLSTGSWYLISAFAPHFFHVAVGTSILPRYQMAPLTRRWCFPASYAFYTPFLLM